MVQTVLNFGKRYKDDLTADVFESGPMPTSWNCLAGHLYQFLNSIKTKPRLAGN